MKFLPIVIRELLVASRRVATYRNRFWVPLLGILISFVVVTAVESRGLGGAVQQGRTLFSALAILGLIHALFVGVRVTADCLSVEKRDGTLGLLFLTDLSGVDVVFGKLAATSLNSIYGLLALVPILAIPLQMGGVSGLLFFLVVLCLLNALFLSLATGILVSALSFHDRKAMVAAVLTMIVLSGGPYAVVVYVETLEAAVPHALRSLAWLGLLLSPISPFLIATSTEVMGLTLNQMLVTVGLGGGLSFPVTLLASHGMAWGFLFVASRLVVGFVRQEGRITWVQRLTAGMHRLIYGSESVRRAHRQRYLELNAFSWLTSREPLKTKYVWIFVGAIILIYLSNLRSQGDVMFDDRTLIPLGFIIHAFLKIWIASEACYRIAEDQRIGALELVLSTPLGPLEIVKGQFIALWRQFGGAMIVLVFFELVLIFGFATESRENSGFRTRSIYLGAVVILVIDCLLIGWVAMWNGVRLGMANRAIARTVMMFLVVPWFLYLVAALGIDALQGLLAPGGLLTLGFAWLGRPEWRLDIAWSPIGTQGRVLLWVMVGGLYGAVHALKVSRSALLENLRECVANFRGADESDRQV